MTIEHEGPPTAPIRELEDPPSHGLTPALDPSLLDVVPWSYGFAHSWALAALLRDPVIAGRILSHVRMRAGTAPYLVTRVVPEFAQEDARADLAITLTDAVGNEHVVAVETKVNDPFRPTQVQAYWDAGFTPLVFLPGLTGVLIEHTSPASGESRLTGRQLLDAVSGFGMGALLSGYVDSLRTETERIERACRLARGLEAEEIGDGRVTVQALSGAAWLSEVFRNLRDSSGADPGQMRTTANDRGINLSDLTWRDLNGLNGGLYVEVLADIRTGARAIAIKAGVGEGVSLAAIWDRAADGVEPSVGWRRASRRVRGGSATVWKLDVDELPADAAAREVLVAAAWIEQLAGRPGATP